MVIRLILAALLTASAAAPPRAEARGDLYEVTARIELPNVAPVAEPIRATLCLTAEALRTAAAFRVLSRNPLAACARSDVTVSCAATTFRIACPGPNAPWALARFEVTGRGFKGAIHMNMGGKNMTMTERQSARRIGDCP